MSPVPKVRTKLLEDDPDGPLNGREWPLERIERFCERLQRFADQGSYSELSEMVVPARRHKRRLDDAREALTVANLRLVVHVAKDPPSSLMIRYAAAQGKRVVHIPIGSLSPITVKKIRVVHLLAGRDKRKVAKDYIW